MGWHTLAVFMHHLSDRGLGRIARKLRLSGQQL